MDHFALIQSLLERCIRVEQRDNLAAIIEAAIDRLGFGYFACCSHTDPLAPAPGGSHAPQLSDDVGESVRHGAVA